MKLHVTLGGLIGLWAVWRLFGKNCPGTAILLLLAIIF